MLATAFTAFLAFTTGLVAALPNPAQAEVPTRVEAPLAKRTDHYGIGTIYEQHGAYGSCGIQNPDSALIGALGNYWMKNQYQSEYCGRLIKVTNTGSDDGVGGKGNSIVVKVQDTCASCDENHIDFSVGAWNQLTNNAAWGTVNIVWHFCNVNGQC